MRTSIGIRKRRLIILLIVLFTSFLAKPGKAQVLLEESFEGQSVDGGTVYGGTFTQGKVGLGWSSSLVREGSKEEGRVFIQHDLPSGFFQDEGTLEFFLQRKEKPLSGEVREESIIEISDADYKSIITVKILWDNPKLLGSEGSGLQVYGNYLIEELASEPWGGEYFPFGRAVEPGEWVHVAVTWGTGKKENNVYLNGVVLTRVRNEYGIHHEPKSLYLADILEKATHVRIGGESFTSDPEITWSPLSNSIVDELKIHDQAFNPMFPEIRSVSHDVFSVAGYSGKLVSGDTYTVTLQAPPGGTATFDLIQPASTSNEITIPEKVRIVGHPMSEDPENPGTYTGVHIVKYGEDVKDGQIIGHFVNAFGVKADPVPASRQITVDTRVYMDVRANNDLVPADGESKSGITIISRDANGKAIRGHELKLTLSTTDEYTGTVGGGSFEDLVGGSIDVDWGGITDSFGEVNAQYLSGFAAKTTLVSAKNMVTGDVDVAWVRSYIDGTVDIVVTEPRASALSVAGSMDVSLSRDWLTADGRSRSRITAVVEDASGKFLSGHSVQFTLLGDNGSIRVIQGKTDSRGRAMADYIAGIVMGQVQVEVRDMTSGMVAIVPIELRPDAPAEIILAADPGEIVTGGQSTVTAKVTDANGNPNRNVDVLYDVSVGEGAVSAPSVSTDEKGNASVAFTSGKAGLVTVRGTVISREPTAEEISAAQGAVFLYGLDEDPGRLEVVEWLVEAGDEVVEGQDLVTLEDRRDNLYNVVAPRDGVVSTFVAEERDRVEYGDTLGYVIEKPE